MRKMNVIKVVAKYYECAESDLIRSKERVNKPFNKDIKIIDKTAICPILQRTYYLFGVIPIFRITRYAQYLGFRINHNSKRN